MGSSRRRRFRIVKVTLCDRWVSGMCREGSKRQPIYCPWERALAEGEDPGLCCHKQLIRFRKGSK